MPSTHDTTCSCLHSQPHSVFLRWSDSLFVHQSSCFGTSCTLSTSPIPCYSFRSLCPLSLNLLLLLLHKDENALHANQPSEQMMYFMVARLRKYHFAGAPSSQEAIERDSTPKCLQGCSPKTECWTSSTMAAILLQGRTHDSAVVRF